jgi:hypothetical protein
MYGDPTPTKFTNLSEAVDLANDQLMDLMKKILFFLALLVTNLSAHADCPSVATLKLDSSGYQGIVNIELRKGNRPGSVVIANDSINTRGIAIFSGICAGRYFYSFGTPDSDQVSTTQYFEVINDGNRYSMPTITVVYTRSSSTGNRVGSVKKKDL